MVNKTDMVSASTRHIVELDEQNKQIKWYIDNTQEIVNSAMKKKAFDIENMGREVWMGRPNLNSVIREDPSKEVAFILNFEE